MRISKIGTFKDPLIEKQINEIISKSATKEVTVTFTAASTTTKADVGFKVDRYIPVSKSADIRVWHVDSDNRYLYLQASGAGTVTLEVWKS